MKTSDISNTRVIGIGDIHGNCDALERLIAVIDFKPDNGDVLVFVGDYIDRGKANKQVVKLLTNMKAKHPDHIVLLRGNHEDMAMTAFQQGEHSEADMLWRRNGGTETIANYGGFDNAREALSGFLRTLDLFYVTNFGIFVHAGFPVLEDGAPKCHDNYDENDMHALLWQRDFSNYCKKQLIVGHTPQRRVTKYDNIIAIDTHAYARGLLSAYDVIANTVYESGGEIYPLYQQEVWRM